MDPLDSNDVFLEGFPWSFATSFSGELGQPNIGWSLQLAVCTPYIPALHSLLLGIFQKRNPLFATFSQNQNNYSYDSGLVNLLIFTFIFIYIRRQPNIKMIPWFSFLPTFPSHPATPIRLPVFYQLRLGCHWWKNAKIGFFRVAMGGLLSGVT